MTKNHQKQSINHLNRPFSRLGRSKKPLAFLLCLFIVGFGYGQNLVPNFGFEEFDTCPTTEDQVQYATGWFKVCETFSTPDYYNACAPITEFGVPQSNAQYQTDGRGCGAYVGMITYYLPENFPNYREQVGIQLSQPLTIGQKYYLSFKTVMAGQTDGTDYYDSPSNNIGLRFSNNAHSPSNPAPIDNFAHLRSSTKINDTVNWVRVTGSFIADSTYSYVMLGNFFDDANTDTTMLNCSTCFNWYSYYLVDDICVSTDSTFCNGGIDALSCNVSVKELMNDKVSIFPNPSTDDLIKIIFQNADIEEIYLTDVSGKIIYAEKTDGKTSINLNVSSFSAGVYFLKANDNKNKESISKKIVKL